MHLSVHSCAQQSRQIHKYRSVHTGGAALGRAVALAVRLPLGFWCRALCRVRDVFIALCTVKQTKEQQNTDFALDAFVPQPGGAGQAPICSAWGMSPLQSGAWCCWGALGAKGAQGTLCVLNSVPGSCHSQGSAGGGSVASAAPTFPLGISGVLHTHCGASRTCSLSASPPVLLRELGLMAAHGR